MTEVRKMTTWIPVTVESIADGPFIRAPLEYHLSRAADAPLSPTETMTGLRSFTSSEGVTIRMRVGWRLALWEQMRRFAMEAWPEDFVEEDDW